MLGFGRIRLLRSDYHLNTVRKFYHLLNILALVINNTCLFLDCNHSHNQDDFRIRSLVLDQGLFVLVLDISYLFRKIILDSN